MSKLFGAVCLSITTPRMLNLFTYFAPSCPQVGHHMYRLCCSVALMPRCRVAAHTEPPQAVCPFHPQWTLCSVTTVHIPP
jgi:hypothetical protein